MKLSPLAPATTAVLPEIPGVLLSVAESGIRYENRPDLLLVSVSEKTQVAGVLTQSKVVAAPVLWCRRVLNSPSARGLIVNAGNANAFTAESGMQSVLRVTEAVADALGCKPNEVLMASTGVIGEPLPDAKIIALLPELASALTPHGWSDAARAIMTTDTFMKVATAKTRIGDIEVTINGIAKGSGMIAPDMATLLAFVFTDAALPASVLQELVVQANEQSFNAITVDGDTSTNDTLLAFATQKARHEAVNYASDPKLNGFKAAMLDVLIGLAVQVVKDGEGAQKLVTIEVMGAASDMAARRIAFTIANSPLVKTAIAGEDANWGRIVAAAGRAGEEMAQEKIEVHIGGILVAKDGARAMGYDEAPVAAHMKGKDIRITLHLHSGKGAAKVYTCDLTHGYIDINGSYRS